MKLGVNIDHVATLRQARYRTKRKVHSWAEPNLLEAARAVERAGAHGITMHLREDRRHIQDDDIWIIQRKCSLPLNLEMAANPKILKIALQLRPAEICMVPERREEVTTEGGLDVVKNWRRLEKYIHTLRKNRIVTSLFIAPVASQVRAASAIGAEYVELHTGAYAEACHHSGRQQEWSRLNQAAQLAASLGLKVNAGHGIRSTNIQPILRLPFLETLNIGHSIVSRAVIVGLEKAVREMLQKMRNK